jgi:hypothetical protein
MSPRERFCNLARSVWRRIPPFIKTVVCAVHITCAQPQRRLDHYKVQSPQAGKSLNVFAPAAANGGAWFQKERHITAQLGRKLCQSTGRPMEPPRPIRQAQRGSRIGGTAA